MRGSLLVGYLLLLSVVADGVSGLECWKCMGKDCDLEPDNNDNAKAIRCMQGQSCQKVYFEMLDYQTNVRYTSTVRGCASYCAARDDFANCTYQLHTTTGCVRKNCCHDGDLCNHGNGLKETFSVVISCALCISLLLNNFKTVLY